MSRYAANVFAAMRYIVACIYGTIVYPLELSQQAFVVWQTCAKHFGGTDMRHLRYGIEELAQAVSQPLDAEQTRALRRFAERCVRRRSRAHRCAQIRPAAHELC